MNGLETTAARILALLAIVFGLSFAGTARAQDDTQNNYQLEKYNTEQERWEKYTGSSNFEVGKGDLADVTQGDDEWFEWGEEDCRMRLRKDRIPKDSIKDGFQDAADNDVQINIYVNSGGTLNKIELGDK